MKGKEFYHFNKEPRRNALVGILLLCLTLVLVTAVSAMADDGVESNRADQKVAEAGMKSKSENAKQAAKPKGKGDGAKELSGMSIVGNDEAPKSLYIVPWKSSEIGVETTLNTSLNEGDAPVDRDVFMRQLEFFKVSRGQ